MAPLKHALLSPSAAHRWMECPASAKIEAKYPEQTSAAAAEGTVAHKYAETLLNQYLLYHHTQMAKMQDAEMQEAVQAYADYCVRIFEDAGKDAKMFVELSVDIREAQSFGTSDCVIVAGDTLHVIDFKYGRGVRVEAEGNVQMLMYALGALQTLSREITTNVKNVKTHIVQPRLNNFATDYIYRIELEAWGREHLAPSAYAAHNIKAFAAGEHCRFCKHKANCRALQAEALAIVDDYERGRTDLADALGKADTVSAWVSAIKAEAFERINSGKNVEGWTLKACQRRVIGDPNTLAKRLRKRGIAAADIYKERELKSITELKRLCGKDVFDELSDGCIAYKQTQATLARVNIDKQL